MISRKLIMLTRNIAPIALTLLALSTLGSAHAAVANWESPASVAGASTPSKTRAEVKMEIAGAAKTGLLSGTSLDYPKVAPEAKSLTREQVRMELRASQAMQHGRFTNSYL
jgi:Domain of unknown function (DUF4148)